MRDTRLELLLSLGERGMGGLGEARRECRPKLAPALIDVSRGAASGESPNPLFASSSDVDSEPLLSLYQP